MNKFEMALDVLGWEAQDLNDCLVEFAQYNMKNIYKKIKNNNVKTLSNSDLTKLCNEFMFAFQEMIKQFQQENGDN